MNVVDITFGTNRLIRGFPLNRWNITILWPFVILSFFLHRTPSSNRCTDSYAKWLRRRVSAQERSFWGSWRWVTSSGENMPQKFPKKGVNKQFQAKTPKFRPIHRRNISRTINLTNKRFQDQVQTIKRTSWVVCHYPKANRTWLTAAILKIDMMSYFRSS